LQYEGVDTSNWDKFSFYENSFCEEVLDRYELGKTPGEDCRQHRLLGHYDIRSSYFKFGFVRNPYSKFVSEYNYFKKLYKTHPDIISFSSELCDFKTFARNINKVDWPEHRYMQYKFFTLKGKTPYQSMDFIGRMENLQQDFDIVCEKIGIPRQELPHANLTNSKHYTEYYDDETRELVAERYAKDIEYFGYKFGE
tara:strand:+ start:209 stop:796 length:588 start_codon:yes stop_codon:yes gene_type:complete